MTGTLSVFVTDGQGVEATSLADVSAKDALAEAKKQTNTLGVTSVRIVDVDAAQEVWSWADDGQGVVWPTAQEQAQRHTERHQPPAAKGKGRRRGGNDDG